MINLFFRGILLPLIQVVLFLTLLVFIAGVGFLWMNSGERFYYLAIPTPHEEAMTVSIGAGHGHLFFSFGCPVEDGFSSEPIYGSSKDEEETYGPLAPEERLRMASEQFGMKTGGTPQPANCAIHVLPLWATLFLGFGFLAPLLLLRW